MAQWIFRPKEDEHEKMIEAMKEGRYETRAAFIREAVIRMLHDRDVRPLYSEVEDLIDSLQDARQRFFKTLLHHTEE